MRYLTEEQRRPVEDTEGAVLVFAGAGSGKTRVLTERIAHIVNNKGVPLDNILAITFTNKAAEEMKSRLEGLVLCSSAMWINTIHSMCAKFLRKFGEYLGYDKNFTIYSTIDKERVLKRVMDELEIGEEAVRKSVDWHISEAKSKHLSPDVYEEQNVHNKHIKAITQVFRRYEGELYRSNAMDFDDLLIKALELLSNHKEVAEYYQAMFRYIHIDEFQDTNKVQYDIIKILAAGHGNIFAVGDDDQSIYGWRGADINNILNFEKDFAGCRIYKLEQNFRSTKNILEAANKVICKNTKRYPKKLFTSKSEGVRVESYAGFDEIDETRYVVSAIDSLVRYSGIKYRNIAILMRINALSRTLEQELRRRNIPYMVFGGFKFFERKEIKDLLAYLRVIVNPRDEEALLRIINVPKRGIGDTAVGHLTNESRMLGQSLFDTIMSVEKTSIPARILPKFIVLKEIFEVLMLLSKTLPLDEFVKRLIEIIGYKEQFYEKTEENLSRLFNINEFTVSVKEFTDQNSGADLADYLTSVSLSSDLDDANETDYVSIATIHSAKGLEFNTVFIVGLDEKIFPIVRTNDVSDIEEERRLMYVAITRAKERLYLTRAKSRFLFGERSFTVPSRYYNELFPAKTEREMPYSTYQSPIELPQEQKKAIDYDAFDVGVSVSHRVFGEGVIISSEGRGEDKTVEVLFKGAGKKRLSLQFAPLRIINNN